MPDLLCEVEKGTVLLLALLQEFVVGLNLLAQVEQLLVQDSAQRGRNREGGCGLRRLSGARRGRAMGLLKTVEAAPCLFELRFDLLVLAFPIVAALAERPDEGVGRA